MSGWHRRRRRCRTTHARLRALHGGGVAAGTPDDECFRHAWGWADRDREFRHSFEVTRHPLLDMLDTKRHVRLAKWGGGTIARFWKILARIPIAPRLMTGFLLLAASAGLLAAFCLNATLTDLLRLL